MAQLMEYAEYLSKEIGPRPAGTEEEQQAALYITERFQKDSGFSAQIEEFTSASNIEGLAAIPGLVVIVVAILGMIFPILAIPAFILAAAAAVLYALEAFGHPIVTHALARGASQNVVAKYQPNPEAERTARGRSRKIVLVAHYDSGKVTPSLVRTVESLKLPVPIGLICVAGIVLAAFFLLLHVFINTGVGAIVINILTIITLVICAYPVLRAILYRTAPYNEGANNNATGTAALIEVARRISRGSVSEADLADDPASMGVTIHGEAAARESGLVPEGAQIRYEAERLVPPSELGEYDEEERLLAAKAAIAALTGQPVERRTFGSVATKLVNSRAHGEGPAPEVSAEAPEAGFAESDNQVQQAAAPAAQVNAAQVEYAESVARADIESAPVSPTVAEPVQADGFSNAPSWFVAAQQNAKKSEGDGGPVQRSRYAEAIEAAEREAAERERERMEAERLQREAELRAREQAARAAIEQSAMADRAEIESAPQPADMSAAELAVEPMPVAVPTSEAVPDDAPVQAAEHEPAHATLADSAQGGTPVFVPYNEANPINSQPVSMQPANDEFAEALGKTTAFNPRQLQAQEAGAERTAAEESRGRSHRRLEGLPSFDGAADPASASQTTSPSRSGMFRKLRADVPSMSGVIRMQAAGQDVSQRPVETPIATPTIPDEAALTQAVAPTRHRGPEAVSIPAGEQIDYDMSVGDIGNYPDYADNPDSSYDERYDAYSDYDDYDDDYGGYDDNSPSDQVDIPKSRAGGLLSRFRRKKRDDLSETPQEWLNVDDDFDARTVGRERGGWESFRDDAHGEGESSPRRRWEGGSFSRVRLGRVNTRSGENAEADIPSEPVEVEEDRQIADEIEQIYHFRNPQYNTEVWFVALGSEGAMHDGTKAFLAEHADELRGSMIIEVESLGAGELCVASAEGCVKRLAASSRVKRYTRAATAATGIAPGSVDLVGSDSAASILQGAGYQAMHLLGVEDGKPALKGSPDDIMENVDDLLLDDNVNFLMELLKK